MFQLRIEHVEALNTTVRSEFHARILNRFRTTMPTITKQRTDTELLETIAAADRNAMKYGLSTFRDISEWCLLSVISGLDFYKLPVVGELLAKDPPNCGPILTQLVGAFATAAKSVSEAAQPTAGGRN